MTENATPGRIGVLGGTFDPVHNGHLHVANSLRNALELDQIIWVPAGRPPHKRGQIVSSDRDRLAMLELAIAGSPCDEISRVDLDREGPSYTADMLELLDEQHRPARLVFLMGEDSLRDFPNWRDPERILRVAELAVAERPGIETDLISLIRAIPALQDRVWLVPTEEVAISSSDIRHRARAGLPIDGLVPPGVAEYIATHRLYQGEQGDEAPPASAQTS
ncbi:MAG: nicotinate-nucleotide adenylyltransferase [Thermomicrobiales bacterium]|nr:nicotinate-nucleotide adenylyltransferase [Thermomicrobiales bacterium]